MKSRLLISVLSMLFIFNCGGGSSEDIIGDIEELVEKTIDSTGGEITLPSGFNVTFPEGALDVPVLVTVEKITLPSPLPNDITVVSPVYNIDADNEKLNLPATVTFPDTVLTSLPQQEGEFGIYKWDGNIWSFAGGYLKDNKIFASMDSFSIFVIGTGRSLHFPVEFNSHFNTFDPVVKPYRYILAHPDLDAPISDSYSVVVFSPPFDYVPAIMILPQGQYTFCMEWSENTTDGPKDYFGFVGALPSQPAASLHENSFFIVPEQVYLHTEVAGEGRCPVPQAWTDGDTSIEDALPSDFVGVFNGLDPNRTSANYRAIFTFNINGTFSGDEWVNGIKGSFTGTWSYDPDTQIFALSVPNGGVFSGQVIGSIRNFIISGTWNNGNPGQMHFYR